MTTIRVSIVEDSVVFRTRLRDFINAQADLRCIGTYRASAAMDALPQSTPDVVLIDLQLPNLAGLECLARLKERMPATEFMIFTVREDADQIFGALKAGATGYLLKRTSPDVIIAAIRDLHRGGAPMSSEIARKVVQSFRADTVARAKPAIGGLSPRQGEILHLLAHGRAVKEIAHELALSTDTVRSYLKVIYQKLRVRSRTEAMLRYLQEVKVPTPATANLTSPTPGRSEP